MQIKGQQLKKAQIKSKSPQLTNKNDKVDQKLKKKQEQPKPSFFQKIFGSKQKTEPKPQNQQKPDTQFKEPTIKQKYQACMVLSAVGDAMGYKNGDWEFNTSSKIIHQEMMELTKNKGIKELKINLEWRYSDDTVMHIATADALIAQKKNLNIINKVAQQIAVEYKESGKRMSGRAPGKTCMKSIMILNADGSNWDKIPFRDRSVGCGGSMRSACIGLVYWRPEKIKQLIAVSIQAGRITHHNPIGYLGSMVSAYFTSLAIQKIPPKLWMKYLFTIALPESESYIRISNRQVKNNLQTEFWATFKNFCIEFAEDRNLAIEEGQDKEPKFPNDYNFDKQMNFYRKISFGNWPGATGIDSVLIAYDAILGSETFKTDAEKWQQFCLRGVLHGGDNDSTGAIGGAWFGALHGFSGVPLKNYKEVEDNVKLKNLGDKLYEIASN